MMLKRVMIATTVFFVSGLAWSEPYAVPALQEDDPLPLFSEQKPLLAKEKKALVKAQEWINEEQYPIRNGNGITYLYGQGQATIVCAPLKLCVLKLDQDERVVPHGFQIGDSARWVTTPVIDQNNRTYIALKPIDVGLETSLAIITDRRTYHIKLVSRAQDYMPIVSFHYPEKSMEQWQDYYAQQAQEQVKNTLPKTDQNVSDLDFNYTISSCSRCRWRPLRVYNNQEQTFIQMNQDMNHSEAPALLVKNTEGEQMVNYRVHGDRYIVDQVFDEAILIAGVGRQQNRVTITRNNTGE